MPSQPTCEYFSPIHDSSDNKLVLGCDQPAGDGPLYLFVPVGLSAAVRVPVCERHAKLLADQTAPWGEMD